MLLEVAVGAPIGLLEEGCALALLLAVGVHFTLGKAVGYKEASSGLALSGGCGPVSTGPEGDMGLSFVGETASGSSSSAIDTPFPFFLDVSGVTISQLAELLVLRVLFRWASSPTEGVVELMVERNEEFCWQAPGLNRVSWQSGYTQGCIFPGVRVCFP